MKAQVPFFLRIAVAAGLCAGCAAAQVAPTASLVGTVADTSGGVIAGASVVLANLGTGLTKETRTNATGAYSFTLLPVGAYKITAQASGFLTYEQTGINLRVDTATRVNITLQVGAVSEQVTVKADAAMVATESGTLSQVVTDQYIENLPLNGRNAATLVRMVPGTVTGVGQTTARYANTPETQAISVNGSRGNEVNYKLDGATHLDNVTNLNAIYPNPDALAEFSVQTSNYSAQYGEASGAVVNVVTRSGTNRLHGAAFEFLRNGSLNARDFFAPEHDALKRNQFGGTLGGPIIKNKMFFFGSYQGTTINNTTFSNTAFVPSDAMRAGDFSAVKKAIKDPETGKPFPGNRIPAERILPIATKLLQYVPETSDPSGRYLFSRPETVRSHQFLGKVDYNSGNHMLSGSFFYARFRDRGWDGAGTLLTARIGQQQTTKSVKFQELYTIRPNLINTFVGSALILDSFNLPTSQFVMQDFGSLNIAAPQREFGELEMSVTGFGGWGAVSNAPPGEWIRNHVELSDTLSYIHGKHSLVAGVEVNPWIKFDSTTRYHQSGNFKFSGQITGNGMSDLLLGKVATFQQSAGKNKRTNGRQMSAFVEDKYNARNDLTLTFGLRWDPYFPYHDNLGQVAGYRDGFQSDRFVNAPVGAIFAGDPGFPSGGSSNDANNLAPRFGFAWRPLKGRHATSIRGGYGLFYVRPFVRLYNNFVENPPFSPSVSLNGVDLTDPYGSAGIQNPFPPFAPVPLDKDVAFVLPATFAVFEPNWKAGYVQSWNLTIEHQLAANLLLRTAYVGNKGTHLQTFRERNPAIYGPGATLKNTDKRRPLYPNFASLKEMVDDANSSYQSLQVTLDKRFSRNFSLLAFYTFSKSIDDESVNYQFTVVNPNPFDPGFNRGLSDFDVPHNFRVTGVFDLPKLAGQSAAFRHIVGGWQFMEILDWHSGTPFSLTSGRDNSFTGIGRDRADLQGNPALSNGRPRQDVINQYFDTGLVTTNAAGTFGNAPRNFLRNVRFFNMDASLQKIFPVTERCQFQFRAEFFNAFNNVHLNQPGTNVSSRSTFGRITSAGEPRILQFGAKIVF